MPIEKTDDTCNFYRCQQPKRKPRGEINASLGRRRTRYISGATTIGRVLRSRFSLLCISTAARSDRYGKRETERRGVSGSKRKPLNEISTEQKTEKGREASGVASVSFPRVYASNFNWSIKANEIYSVKFPSDYLFRANNSNPKSGLLQYRTS